MAYNLTNLAHSLVAVAPSPATSGTSLEVTAGHGSRFSAASFVVGICPNDERPSVDNTEFAICTAKSTDTFTLTRAQFGPSARTVVVGDFIFEPIMAELLNALAPLTDYLSVPAADTIAIDDGTTPTALHIYKTLSGGNYERFQIEWDAVNGAFDIGAKAAGTGTQRNLFFFGPVVTFWNDRTFSSQPRVSVGGFVVGNQVILSGTSTFFRIADNSDSAGIALEMVEMTAPAAPAANTVRIYAEDNGSGKTRLMAKFATGSAVQIAIEP